MRPGRPRCPRRAEEEPTVSHFKPRGVPLVELKVVTLSLEELEAIRLTDMEGMDQRRAEEMMGVSWLALWEGLRGVQRKIVEVLVNGNAIETAGGQYVLADRTDGSCQRCRPRMQSPREGDGASECPRCGKGRTKVDRGWDGHYSYGAAGSQAHPVAKVCFRKET